MSAPAYLGGSEVRHQGWSYKAELYDKWVPSYDGASPLVKYFRYDNQWQPLPWNAMPKAAYRKLRAGLQDIIRDHYPSAVSARRSTRARRSR